MIATSTALEPIYVADSLTEAWHSARKTGIGASSAAAACGMSRYSTQLEVYCRARGLLPDLEDNDAMRMGRKLEPVVISEFTELTGIAVRRYPCPMVRHPLPECSFMLATPDAELETDELLEAKTTTYWNHRDFYGEEGTDSTPSEIVFQVQHQMAVTGFEVCHVATLVDGRKLRLHRVERNEKLIARMIERERDLWEKIVAGTPPEPDFTHASTPDLLKELHRTVDDSKVATLSDQAAKNWAEYVCLGEQEKEIKKRRDQFKSAVAFEMGDAAIGRFAPGAFGDDPAAQIELVRSIVAGGEVSYFRKDYTTLRSRKAR